jgi:uncharacterized protein (DUF58 family)
VALWGLALTLAALMFDASPLFIPGVAFVLLGVTMPVWISLALGGARIRRRLHTRRVVEGEPLEATVEVKRGRWGLPGAEVVDPLAGSPVPLRGTLSLLAGDEVASIRVVARFPRRGRRLIEPPSLIVRDGLELARTVRRSAAPADEVLVLPKVEHVRWLAGSPEGLLDPRDPGSLSEPHAAVELDGLRPYRQGTPASRIHWPALARGVGLLERRLAADGDSRPLVVLDPRSSGPIEHLDAAVRAAASLTVALARRRACGLLLPGERRPLDVAPDLAGWPAAHARLALVEQEPTTAPPGFAARSSLGAVFYVAAQPIKRPPPSLVGTGGLVLVLPIELSPDLNGGPSFEVTGCLGFVLGAGTRRRRAARERVA